MMLISTLLPLMAALPLSLAANLIEGGGFENGTWGLWTQQPGSVGNISVASPGYGGSKYAGAHDISTADGSVEVYYPLIENLTLGQQYMWSFDLKLNNPYCTVLVQNYEGIPLSLGYGTNPVANGTWDSYNSTFFARQGEEGFSLVTYCSVPANASLPTGHTSEFDNLVFEPVGSTVYHNNSKHTGPNLIKQPNFDSGTLGAYQVVKQGNVTAKVVSPGYNGTAHAASVNMTGVFESPAALELLQTVSGTKKDAVYKISITFKTLITLSEFCAGELYIQQGGFPANTEYIPYQFASQWPVSDNTIPPAGKWVTYENVIVGLSDSFQVGVELDCVFDTAEMEVGAFELYPLN